MAVSESQPLQPLPGRSGWLMGLRETLAYLRDPDRFVAERSAAFGPVFGTTLFFRPTAVVGGVEGVADFLQQEEVIAESSLPAAFTALHTPYGALNQHGERHRATRAGYGPVLNRAALQQALPVLDRGFSAFAERVQQQGSTRLAKELKLLCLNLFAEIFAGEALSSAEQDAFQTYNAALLSLSTRLPSFRRGQQALAFLQEQMQQRLERFRRGELQGSCLAVFSANRDEQDQPWSDERIVTATILLIWGAYIEVAALLASSLILSRDQPQVRERILAEARQHPLQSSTAETSLQAWDLPYTQGVLREALRLLPPGGGGFRLAAADVAIGGYRIPAGTVVTADPRIGNRLAALFPEPDRFQPERWLESSGSRCPLAGTALRLPRGAWFPGGTGQHGCPGIPLAELCGRIFLVRWMQAIGRWQLPAAAAAIPYTLLPIRIPTDAFCLEVEAP